MNKKEVIVFLGGDVYGNAGLECVSQTFASLKKSECIDFAVINGENAAGGKGLTHTEAKILFDAGIDVITTGNHTFEKKEILELFDVEERVLRPANYPEIKLFGGDIEIPGKGLDFFCVNGVEFAVLNLLGREFMNAMDCPFLCAYNAAKIAAEKNAILLIDFHAESNEEKQALGIYMDGKVSAVCGTHTHVQTADECILPNGTAYITDLGMSGAQDSVIGTKNEIAVMRNLSLVPHKLENAEGEGTLQGVIITIDLETKKATKIKRVS